MSRKLKFDVEAIDGSFTREYDTVEEFKTNELGKYVGLSSGSMTSSDGICVYYPADDYTRDQIDNYQMIKTAEKKAELFDLNSEVIIANGSGLGYTNLYIMQQHNKKNGNDGSYHVDTEKGRFFIYTKDDGSMFDPVKQGERGFDIIHSKEKDMISVFTNEDLGFGVKKKEGINSFLINPSTMLVQDTTKTHSSLDSIKEMKSSSEKGVIATIRSVYYDGNEDTPGTTSFYTPAIISADNETYQEILNAHYPESIRDNGDERYYYDETYWVATKASGYVFDKDHPIEARNVKGFNAKIVKDGEVTTGEIIHVDKDFLSEMFSSDDKGLTMYDGMFNVVYLELGKTYEAIGSPHCRTRSIAPLPPETKFKKIADPGVDADFLF